MANHLESGVQQTIRWNEAIFGDQIFDALVAPSALVVEVEVHRIGLVGLREPDGVPRTADPLSSNVRSAAVNVTLRVPATGQRDVPVSSRFAQIQKPPAS
jgi:hypothetical protein